MDLSAADPRDLVAFGQARLAEHPMPGPQPGPLKAPDHPLDSCLDCDLLRISIAMWQNHPDFRDEWL